MLVVSKGLAQDVRLNLTLWVLQSLFKVDSPPFLTLVGVHDIKVYGFYLLRGYRLYRYYS